MHELLLYGQVPVGRHDQVLKILAGHAAVQPRHILQRCIIYIPQREPQEPGSRAKGGGAQEIKQKQTTKASQAAQAAQAQLYYTKLIQKLSKEDFGTEGGLLQPDGEVLSAEVKDGEGSKWFRRWEDIPDTGDRGVSVRFTNTTDILSGDPHAQMVAAGPSR